MVAEKSTSESFSGFYRQYVERVYRYLYFHTSNRADAEDITTQTFMAAMKTWHDERTAAWLFAIARRKLADHYRQQYRHPELDLEDTNLFPTLESPLEETVIQRLQVERVIKALRALSADRSQAVTLHLFADLSIHEVAKVMGKREGAVKMLIHRALQDLRLRLQGEEA
jgi:RNA polymerase sigma-70 factor (ECF subfamily)